MLCGNLGRWDEGGNGKVQERGAKYAYDWFTSFYRGNWQNIVKQLCLNITTKVWTSSDCFSLTTKQKVRSSAENEDDGEDFKQRGENVKGSFRIVQE